MTKEQLSQQLVDLRANIDAQDKARTEIKLSEQYMALQKTMQECQEAQAEMLSMVADSKPLYDEMKKMAIDIMLRENIDHFGVLTGKYTEKKAVNQSKLMDMLGGDIGLFMELSSVTQKALTDFAKTSGNKGLLNSIEVVSRDLVDIEIINI